MHAAVRRATLNRSAQASREIIPIDIVLSVCFGVRCDRWQDGGFCVDAHSSSADDDGHVYTPAHTPGEDEDKPVIVETALRYYSTGFLTSDRTGVEAGTLKFSLQYTPVEAAACHMRMRQRTQSELLAEAEDGLKALSGSQQLDPTELKSLIAEEKAGVKAGQLRVRVIGADNLMAADHDGTSDPYVKLRVEGVGKGSCKHTNMKRKTLFPICDQVRRCQTHWRRAPDCSKAQSCGNSW